MNWLDGVGDVSEEEMERREQDGDTNGATVDSVDSTKLN